MLRSPLIHPPLLAALGAAGHGARVLIADANYSHSTNVYPGAALIHLNVRPGLVTVDQVLKVVRENAENAAKVVKHAIAIMPKERKCACGSAMQFAIQTDKDKIPAATRQKLGILLEKYLGKGQEAKA